MRCKDVPDAQRGAHFYAVIVLLRHAEDPQPFIAEGVWSGRILHERRGDGGFGYDPVFLDPEHGRSAAELDAGTEEPHQPPRPRAGGAAAAAGRRHAVSAPCSWPSGSTRCAPARRPRSRRCTARRAPWVALFREQPGYLGTELLRGQRPGHYVTLDRWRSAQDYTAFQQSRHPRYAELDAQGDALTPSERHLGLFDVPDAA